MAGVRAMSVATQPYDFGQASAADQAAHDRQRAAEQFIIDTSKGHAEARRAYREALAAEIVRLKASGVAITAAATIARGKPEIAALKYREDVAEGMKEAAKQAAWRASKDRDAEATRIQWSMRRDLAEGYHPSAGPADAQTYGRRAAA